MAHIDENTLYILWTTGDLVTAENMVFMYACNSLRRKWWQNVHMLTWGAATQLLATEPRIQRAMHTFLELGGEVSVCRRCAENLDVVRSIEATHYQGKYQVYYVGEFFSEVLHSNARVISI